MGFFSNLWNDIKGGAEKISHAIGHVIEGSVNLSKKGIDALLAAGGASLAGQAFNATSLLGATGSSIVNEIQAGINDASNIVNKVITPIKGVVDSVTGIVQQFNDQLIQPIAGVIQKSQQASTDLINAFNTDLKGGLQGILKLPGDITNALTSVDAQFARSQQELATHQTQIVTQYLQPALVDSIGHPLAETSATLKGGLFTPDQAAAFTDLVKLDENITNDSLLKKFDEFEKYITHPSGVVGHLLNGLWSILKFGDLLVAKIEQQIEEVRQQARADLPVSLLSPGELVEAVRRDIICDLDFEKEMLKLGYHQTRQKVLLDIAQYLFSPRDAVDLRARGEIDQKTFDTLMNQNNLDTGQAQALTALMMHILGPGDIAAAKARGYLNTDAYDAMVKAARVQPELMAVINQLEQTLVDPKLLVAMQGRATALQAGFLEATLGSAPPAEIAQQFNRVQAEAGTADLVWQAHWRIPNPEWWVDAYFRGLRTRTEVEAAFAAANVPPEIYDDIFAVEEELPPVWLIPDIIASGVWTKEQAIPQFKKLGFSDANAEVLYQYGYSKSKASKATTAADLQKVSLGNAKTMFDDGLIGSTEYNQILIDHGYSVDAASLTVQLSEFEAAMTQRKAIAQEIVDTANLGEITDTQAQSQLYALGYTEGEVAKWLLKLKQTKAAKAKLPSRADLDKMLKKGLIDNTTYLSTMEALGYSLYWAERFMALA